MVALRVLVVRLLPAFAAGNHKRVGIADFNALQIVGVVAGLLKQVRPHVVQEAVRMLVGDPAVVPAAGPHVVANFRPFVGFVGCPMAGKFALLPYRRLFGLHHLNLGAFLRRSLGRGEGSEGRQRVRFGALLLVLAGGLELQRSPVVALLRLQHHFVGQQLRFEQGAGLHLGGLCHGLDVPGGVRGVEANVRFAEPAVLLGRHVLDPGDDPQLKKNAQVAIVDGFGLHVVLRQPKGQFDGPAAEAKLFVSKLAAGRETPHVLPPGAPVVSKVVLFELGGEPQGDPPPDRGDGHGRRRLVGAAQPANDSDPLLPFADAVRLYLRDGVGVGRGRQH